MSALVVNGPIAPFQRPSDSRAVAFGAHVSGIVGLTLVLTTTGAFDSDELATPRSVTMFAIVSALLIGQSSILAGWALRRCRSSLVAALLTGSGILAAMTAEIHLLKLARVLPYTLDPLYELAAFLAPFVLPITALVFVGRMLWSRPAGARAPVQERPTADHGGNGVSTDRRPVAFRTEQVRRIQSHDHYLLVWTSGRRTMVRGRMADALRQLAHLDGISPHRSWWVARSDIQCIQRQGRNVVLRLCDGAQVPIARGRVESVRRWLSDRVRTAAH